MAKEEEKLKRKRSVLRSLTTKLINNVESILNVEISDLEIENTKAEIEALREQLIDKSLELRKLDNEIQNFIELDDLESEVTVAEEYQEKIIKWKSLITHKINSIDTERNIPPIINAELSSIQANTSGQIIPNELVTIDRNYDLKAVRLPKLQIEKYFGDSAGWTEFWQQFESAIHKNDCLSKVQKFSYLKSLLGGLALNTVSGFSLTSENYDSAVKLLESRFGRKDLIINSLMCKLLNAEPVKNSENLKALRRLYDTCEIQVRSLESMGVTSGMYGQMLYPILLKLLPDEITLEYNRKLINKEESNVMELIEFLKAEVECRESTIMLNDSKREKRNQSFQNTNRYNNLSRDRIRSRGMPDTKYYPRTPAYELLTPVSENKCIFCNEQHNSEFCESLNIDEKREQLRKQGRCYLCLQTRHRIKDCRKKEMCSICNNKHNRAICYKLLNLKDKENTDKIVSTVSYCKPDINSKCPKILLQTCSVKIRKNNRLEPIRILLDNGSMRSFIAQEISRELKLPIVRTEPLSVYGFGAREAIEKTFNVVKVKIENREYPNLKIEIEALETEQISTAHLPAPNINISKIKKLKDLQLADCHENNDKKISLLVGADFYHNIVSGRIKRLNDKLIATETKFGWCLLGVSNCKNELVNMNVIVEDDLISEQLRRFWEFEHLGIESETKPDYFDQEFLKEFESNITYENNRYKVKLPWKVNMRHLLRDNRKVANERLSKLKLKFRNDQSLFAEYKKVLEDYLKEKIIEPVPENSEIPTNHPVFYLPHRAVIREDKTTSKLRIVFDASSHGKGEISLNDCLHTGINLNPDLFDLLLRFRENVIAFTADIKQAFLQIEIDEKDRDVARFLWDEDLNCKGEAGIIFRMTRVIFGINSSPFLLAATIKHHLQRYVEKFPDSFKLLNESLYVDDLIGGEESVEKALNVSLESVNIFENASMNLRKWQTNSTKLRKLWKDKGINLDDSFEPIAQTSQKVLGVSWNPYNDTLYFNTDNLLKFISKRSDSKRFLLQTAGRIFDPIGFIGPFTVKIKCLIQELWCLGLDWDDELPSNLRVKWNEWCDELEGLHKISIPRHYLMGISHTDTNLIEMHFFSDASMRAYGAVVYLRIVHKNGKLSTSFVASKSRVAPLKTVSLPRLELMGALLSARLSKRISESLRYPVSCHFWTDSTIVYFWIQGFPDRFKPFVRNRILEIQKLTKPSQWSHCLGKDNPADLISRGLSISELKKGRLWWHGPTWLSHNKDLWPKPLKIEKCDNVDEILTSEIRGTSINAATMEEYKCSEAVQVKTGTISDFILKFSSFSKLVRITAWCLRFLNNCRNNLENKRKGYLNASELQTSILTLVKCVQHTEFKLEIKCLLKKQQIPANSKFLSLNIFLDENSMLRVGGRLQFSQLSDIRKHQFLLPKNNHFTDLLIDYYHKMSLHAGTQVTLSLIRQTYWFTAGRDKVRRIIYKCITCFRTKNRIVTQLMGNLPKDRVVPSRPFQKTGIDLAGPIITKPNLKRSRVKLKAYIALFICFSTKAVHLEVVSDLSAEAFLACLKRFIARRGKPSDIYSDNATNFKGSKNILDAQLKIYNSEFIQNFIAEEGLTWNFIPPSAPHFGGLWEANIKSVKSHLIKVTQSAILNFEELYTLVTQIEACLNSRPLSPLSADPTDLQPLTPGHFLIGGPLLSLPEYISTQNSLSFSSRWTLIQALRARFWQRWSTDYLTDLQVRLKWKKPQPNLVENQLVLLKDSNKPPMQWKLARIQTVFPGADGLVRVVEVRTSEGVYKRPISKICPLPFQE